LVVFRSSDWRLTRTLARTGRRTRRDNYPNDGPLN
jgi:hypothetical protein